MVPGRAVRCRRRAGLGAATVSLLAALSRDGLLPDCAPSVSAAAASLGRRRDTFGARTRQPVLLSRRSAGPSRSSTGASGVGAVAARWWKSCVNLNAKSPAFAAELPALAYDELAGWGQGGDITRQTMTLVFLRHGGEQALRARTVRRGARRDRRGHGRVFEVWAEGDDDLGRFFDLALLGELVSLELAAVRASTRVPFPPSRGPTRTSPDVRGSGTDGATTARRPPPAGGPGSSASRRGPLPGKTAGSSMR